MGKYYFKQTDALNLRCKLIKTVYLREKLRQIYNKSNEKLKNKFLGGGYPT